MVFRVQIFIQNVLRYIKFGTLENYIIITFAYLLYASAIPEEMLASLKHLFCGTPGLFLQLVVPDNFHPILLPIKPVMVADSGPNITRDKRTLRSEKVNIQQRVSSCGTAYCLSITIIPNYIVYKLLKSDRLFRIPFPGSLR